MTPRRAVLGAVALLLAVAAPAAAQEVVVRATADRSRIHQNEQVILTVEIAGPSLDQVTPPDVSRLHDFEIVGGPSRSTRFQWINGRTSSTVTFSYALRPRSAGGRTIPPLGILVQGRTYHTQPIEIDVLAGGPPATAPPAAPPGFPRPGQPGRPSQGRPQTVGAAVLLRAEVEPRNPYVGQQVTLRILLDTQTEVLNLGLKDTPTFPGFWVEEIELPENLEVKRVQRGEAIYNEYTLMKKALFPTGAGTLTIPPLTYQIQVRRRTADPIESFFFTPTETIARRTEPVTVTVRALPDAGRPASFSGAVGRFNLSVSADRRETRVNDAVGVKVRLNGEGSLNAVNAVGLGEIGDDFKQYPPKVTSTRSFQGDRLRSERVWDYVLIPLAPGAQTIPQVGFSWFDPGAGEYRSASSAAIPIQVARDEGSPGGPGPGVSQSDVRSLRRDIHFIKQAPRGLRDRSRPLYSTPLFPILLALPLAADLGILAWARHRGRRRSTARARRERRARGVARRRLKEARRALGPATSRAFYAAVAGALTEYVADKFDTAAAGLTHDRIEELLASRGAAPEARSEFHRCLEACDYARFAPASSDQEEMRRALERAEGILIALERSLSA